MKMFVPFPLKVRSEDVSSGDERGNMGATVHAGKSSTCQNVPAGTGYGTVLKGNLYLENIGKYPFFRQLDCLF